MDSKQFLKLLDRAGYIPRPYVARGAFPDDQCVAVKFNAAYIIADVVEQMLNREEPYIEMIAALRIFRTTQLDGDIVYWEKMKWTISDS